MPDVPTVEELLALEHPHGRAARTLSIGSWSLHLSGLEESLALALDRRWGPFVRESNGESTRTVRVFAGDGRPWLPAAPGREAYRIEAAAEMGRLVVRSESFGLCPDGPATWRIGLTSSADERLERTIENAARYLAARGAAESGGLALHAAAVERGGRAYLFAGPSRSGKTTIVGLSSPGLSLGDDFAMAVESADGFMAPAVPFDNQETVPRDRPRRSFPVAGIWRLFQSREDRVETSAPPFAEASLIACAALPWAMPDLSETLLANAQRLVQSVPYAHLHFRRSGDFWRLIAPDVTT